MQTRQKKYSKKSTDKKKLSQKINPIEVEGKKTQPNRKKKNVWQDNIQKNNRRVLKQQKKIKAGRMPGSSKNTSFKKRCKGIQGFNRRNRPPNPPEKIFLVSNSTKNLDAWSKSGGKNSKEGHIPIKSKHKLLERQPGVLELHRSKKTREEKKRRPSYCVKNAAGAED